jgi:hypothetical protein
MWDQWPLSFFHFSQYPINHVCHFYLVLVSQDRGSVNVEEGIQIQFGQTDNMAVKLNRVAHGEVHGFNACSCMM